MEMAQGYWEENSNIQAIKYDGNLNFSTATCSEDDCEYGPFRKNKVPRVSNGRVTRTMNSWIKLSALGKISKRLRCGTGSQKTIKCTLTHETYLHLRLRAQDPMSHRIIEKRRRDRMNNCLADLSRLIPAEYLKKGRGRIEKTEIIEMAIKHMKYLQQEQADHTEYYRSGYQECMSEAVKFMTEIEGHFPREALCIRLLNHLQKHCEQISKLQPMHHTPLIAEKLLNLNPSHHQKFMKTNDNDEFQYKNISKMDSENSSDAPLAEFVTRKTKADYEKPTVDTNGISYKYKTDIKHRFNQEKIVHQRRNSATSIDESPSQNSTGSSECYIRVSKCEAANPRFSTDLTSNNNDRCVSKRKIQDENFNVPIFVLHSKGSHYVPASIDYKTLSQYLTNFDILDVPSSMQNLILHPVTINVNYLSNSREQNGIQQGTWTENGE